MDPSPVLSIIFGIGIILFGNALEGGHIDSLIQPTAALIVFGGTIGACWLGATNKEIKYLFKLMPRLLKPEAANRQQLMDDMVKVSTLARREGMLAVEAMLPQISDEYLRRGLRMLVDGYEMTSVRRVLELEADVEEHHGTSSAKILESAGGFAPTVGILGAVLGLIHVMSNLSDPSKLGTGIAVAFVATVYGVGSANLLFLPMGARLKKIVQGDYEVRQMVLTGLEGISSGSNARQIEEMLIPYAGHGPQKKEAA